MFYTLQSCTCCVAITAVLPPVGGCGGALEEAVVGASCRAAAAVSTYRAAMEACSSSRRRAMACTWA
jgi:hypothetical protein